MISTVVKEAITIWPIRRGALFLSILALRKRMLCPKVSMAQGR